MPLSSVTAKRRQGLSWSMCTVIDASFPGHSGGVRRLRIATRILMRRSAGASRLACSTVPSKINTDVASATAAHIQSEADAVPSAAPRVPNPIAPEVICNVLRRRPETPGGHLGRRLRRCLAWRPSSGSVHLVIGYTPQPWELRGQLHFTLRRVPSAQLPRLGAELAPVRIAGTALVVTAWLSVIVSTAIRLRMALCEG